MDEKLDVKITVLLAEEDKKNLDSDIPALRERLKLGAKITSMDLIRGTLRDLHKKIQQGKKIKWPPELELASRSDDKECSSPQ